MEVVILIAIVTVGASALFVALTFNDRTKRTLAPLLERMVSDVFRQIEISNNETRTKLKGIIDKTNNAKNLELNDIEKSIERIDDAIKENFSKGKIDELNRQLRELNESLTRQYEMVSIIENLVKKREAEDVAQMESLASAMLEAEAYVGRQGWGQPPQLFSLATKTSVIAADSEFSDQLQDAAPDALIPIQQDPLPEGEPFDVLASIQWPNEVLGCVLVTEIVTLPPKARNEVPDEPGAAEQYAAAHRDSRDARLAVCVSRDGEHTCGLRIKDEDEVLVSPGLADDLVAALLVTFEPVA